MYYHKNKSSKKCVPLIFVCSVGWILFNQELNTSNQLKNLSSQLTLLELTESSFWEHLVSPQQTLKKSSHCELAVRFPQVTAQLSFITAPLYKLQFVQCKNVGGNSSKRYLGKNTNDKIWLSPIRLQHVYNMLLMAKNKSNLAEIIIVVIITWPKKKC